MTELGNCGSGANWSKPAAAAAAHPGQPDATPGVMHFSYMKHPKETLETMNTLRLSGSLCDVSLRAESEIFPVHKVVMAAVSPYFNAMFCRAGMRECSMMEIPLQNMRAPILKMVVEFAYTSEINICEANVCALLPAATMFQISHIVEACCTFLQQQLDPSLYSFFSYFDYVINKCCNLGFTKLFYMATYGLLKLSLFVLLLTR